jgi:hypothetical protein
VDTVVKTLPPDVYTIVVVNKEPERGPGAVTTPRCVRSVVGVKSSEVVGVEGGTVLSTVGAWLEGAGDGRLFAPVIDGKLVVI